VSELTQVETPEPVPAAKPVESWYSRWKPLIESAFISAITAAAVSGLSTVWFESRLENSKERVSSIIRSKDQFDASQNNVLAQLGLYTGKLFDNAGPANKEQLQTAIVTTQIQINRLRNFLSRIRLY